MAPLPRTNQSGNDISAWHMLNISTHYQHICIFIYRDGTLCLARLKHGTCSKCRNSSDMTHFYSFGAKLSFLFLYNEDPHLLKLLINFLKHLLIKLGLYMRRRGHLDTLILVLQRPAMNLLAALLWRSSVKILVRV